MIDVLVLTVWALYNLALIAGTAYLVQVYDWSMWTFVLTMCFFSSSAYRKKD